ncbi:type I toxin-antitoxin system Fst family toxin [Enterococcus devriesei]|nr:type I toxin-antitoxin system Fst family toxin [Enterococcus devriesei]
MAACPVRGCYSVYELISLVVAPLFVGLVLKLVDHWLDD